MISQLTSTEIENKNNKHINDYYITKRGNEEEITKTKQLMKLGRMS
jgi:hypothetical protein